MNNRGNVLLRNIKNIKPNNSSNKTNSSLSYSQIVSGSKIEGNQQLISTSSAASKTNNTNFDINTILNTNDHNHNSFVNNVNKFLIEQSKILEQQSKVIEILLKKLS